MGTVPDWYPLLQTARYLGVAPWELAEQPLVWQRWAQMAQAAEAAAIEHRRKQHG